MPFLYKKEIGQYGKTNTIKEWKNSKHQSEFNGLYTFQLEKEGVITKSFMTSLLSTGDIQNIDIFDSCERFMRHTDKRADRFYGFLIAL
ncbi:hypothetical protein ACT7DB_07750 [Bacillus cereus]